MEMRNIYKFRYNNRLYIADLDWFRLVEVDQIVWEVVELSSTLEEQELIDQLSRNYPRESVIESLKWLANFQSSGIVFQDASRARTSETKGNRLRIYVPQGKNEWFLDPDSKSF